MGEDSCRRCQHVSLRRKAPFEQKTASPLWGAYGKSAMHAGKPCQNARLREQRKKPPQSAVNMNSTGESTSARRHWLGMAVVTLNILFAYRCCLGGTVFVSDYTSSNILAISPSGGSSIFGNAGTFSHPVGLAFNSAGDLFTANVGNNTISRFTPDGKGTAFAATPIQYAIGLAIDPTENLYLACFTGSSNTSTITKIKPDGTSSVFETPALGSPSAIACDHDGNVYVAFNSFGWMMKYSPDGIGVVIATDIGDVSGIAFDNSDNIYTSDANAGVVHETSGFQSSVIASGLNGPTGLAFDDANDLFVGLHNSGSIEEFSPGALPTILASGLPQVDDIAVKSTVIPEPSVGLYLCMAAFFATVARWRSRRFNAV